MPIHLQKAAFWQREVSAQDNKRYQEACQLPKSGENSWSWSSPNTKSLLQCNYATLSNIWYFLQEYLRQDKVTLVDFAIWHEETMLTFHVKPLGSGLTLMRKYE